jgi:hypothetical protein
MFEPKFKLSKRGYKILKQKGFQLFAKTLYFRWTHLDLNQGPSDYESDALTN